MVELYKLGSNNKKPVIIILEFLQDTIAISYGKYAGRGNKFFVKDIYDFKGNKYKTAVSRYIGEEDNIPKLKYIKNEIIIDNNFSKKLKERMKGGIHFSNCLNQIICSEYGLLYHTLYDDHNEYIPLPDGTYNHYTDVIEDTWKHHLSETYSIKNNRYNGEACLYYYPENTIKSKTVFNMGNFIYQEKYNYEGDVYYKYLVSNEYETKFYNSYGYIYKRYINKEKIVKVE
jgi:hypothetical protein